MNFLKKHIWLLLILLLGGILRLAYLGIVPFGVTHDELGYIYNAYSIAKTGKNVFGQSFPFLTWMIEGGFPFLPVPIYLSSLFFLFLPISATVGRLPSSLLGIADIVLVYLIVKTLFKNKPLALLSGFFLAISPWHLHFARSAYDPNFALFFYLLGILFFLKEARVHRLPLFSASAFLLAIFSYRGMSIIAFPLLFSLFGYTVFALKIAKKQIILFLLSITVIMLVFISVLNLVGTSYTQEALFFANPKLQTTVDTYIREAQGPLFIRRMFLNKPMQIISGLREDYIKSYSPEFLFLYTEPNSIYSIWSRGRLFFFDLPLIILGFVYLFKKQKKEAFLVSSFLLIGGLPGGIGGLPYSARNFFLSAIFPILISGGILLVYESAKRFRLLCVSIFILVYLFLIGGYLFDYYGRYAFYGGEAWAKSLKDLSHLIQTEKNNYKEVVIDTASWGDIVQYMFYEKYHPLETQRLWQKRKTAPNEEFRHANVRFVAECISKDVALSKESTLYVTRGDCNKAKPNAAITDYPGNTVWKIYKYGTP